MSEDEPNDGGFNADGAAKKRPKDAAGKAAGYTDAPTETESEHHWKRQEARHHDREHGETQKKPPR